MDKDLSQQPVLAWWHVLESSAFVFIAAAISLAMGLRLELSLIISGVRCVIQLTLMGYVLDAVLGSNNAGLVALMSLVLLLLGAYEIAFNRTRKTFRGLFLRMFVILVVSNASIALLGSAFALQEQPFWSPPKFIPIVGMLLGNSMGSIAMATEQCLDNISDHANVLETRLSFGATRYEAAKPFAIETIRVSMLPILMQLSVMGMINIPGMMTGQLMAGTPMMDAVIYQQCIMFMVAASSALSVVFAVMMCMHVVIDKHHSLQLDRIRDNKPIIRKEFFIRVVQGVGKLGERVYNLSCRRRYHDHKDVKYEEVEMQ